MRGKKGFQSIAQPTSKDALTAHYLTSTPSKRSAKEQQQQSALPLRYFQFLSAKEGDPKHVGWMHPAIAAVLVISVSTTAMLWLDQCYTSPPPPTFQPPPHRQASAVFLLVYLAVSLLLRCGATRNSQPLYEFLWACNQALLLAAIGLITYRPVLVGAVMIAVSVDQVLWYVDLLGYVFLRSFPVGVAKYLFWPQTSWARRLTSTHHLWFVPYCIYIMGPIPLASFSLSVAFVGVLNILCRWVTPFHLPPVVSTAPNTIRTRRQTSLNKDHEALPRYLNINLVYELWKDIDFAWLKLSHPSAAQHLLRLLIMWSLLNLPFCALLLWASRAWAGAGWDDFREKMGLSSLWSSWKRLCDI